MSVDVGALVLSLGLIAFGGSVGVVAVRVVVEQVVAWRQARASQPWPATAGRILKAELVWAGLRQRRPRPRLEYEYHVGGRQYVGQRRLFEGLRVYETEAAQQVLERYPAGQTVTVYYDPDQPAEATLERRHDGLVSGLLIAFVLLFSPAGFCLITGLIGLRDAFVP